MQWYRGGRRRAGMLALSVGLGLAPGAAHAQGQGDGNLAAARALLEQFAKPGADHAALSARLRPTKADYEAVFTPEAAARLQAVYDPAWNQGQLVLKGKPEQTEVLVFAATAEEIKAWSPA